MRISLRLPNCCSSKAFYNPREELVKRLSYISPKPEKSRLSFTRKESVCENISTKILTRSVEKIKKLCPKFSTTLKGYSLNESSGLLFARFENIAYETKLNKKLNETKKEIDDLKMQRTAKENQLLKLNQKLDGLKLDIDIFSNTEKYRIRIKKPPIAVHSHTEESDRVNRFIKYTVNQKHLKMSKAKCEERKATAKLVKKEIEDAKSAIEAITTKIHEVCKDYNGIKDKLLIHYHTLLKEGTDVRSEGLSWIIKEIYKLKKEVLLTYLPPFLDKKSIDFLFKVARASLQLDEVEREIQNMKDEYKPYLSRNPSHGYLDKSKINKMKMFKAHIKNSSYDRNSVVENNRIDYLRIKLDDFYLIPTSLKLDSVESVLEEKQKIFSSDKNFALVLLKFYTLNETRKKVSEAIQHMKKKECARINDEFLKGEYQKKFLVDKKVVLGAIIGESIISPEIKHRKKEAKGYFEIFKQFSPKVERPSRNIPALNLTTNFTKKILI